MLKGCNLLCCTVPCPSLPRIRAIFACHSPIAFLSCANTPVERHDIVRSTIWPFTLAHATHAHTPLLSSHTPGRTREIHTGSTLPHWIPHPLTTGPRRQCELTRLTRGPYQPKRERKGRSQPRTTQPSARQAKPPEPVHQPKLLELPCQAK